MPASVINKQVYDDDDEKFFMQTLRDFMRKNNQPLGKLPALGFKKGMTLVFLILNCLISTPIFVTTRSWIG